MKLLPSQRNNLFKLIAESGLSPSQFSLAEGKPNGTGQVSVSCKHYPDFSFRFYEAKTFEYLYRIHRSPGQSTFNDSLQCNSFDTILGYFGSWLDCLIREVQEEDLWLKMEQVMSELLLPIEREKAQFSVREYLLLGDRMTQLQAALATIGIPNEKLDIINAKLDDVYKQGQTLSKFDWQSLFIGSIVSLMMTLAITSDVQREFWSIVKVIFNDMLLLSN